MKVPPVFEMHSFKKWSEMADMPMVLKEVNRNSVSECKKIVRFVNAHLERGLPLEYDSLRKGKIVMFWAFVGKEVVGATGFYPRTPLLAESAKTVLHPKFRGKGLGVELSQAVEDEAVARGYRKVFTTIYVSNLPMIFIKLKQGYHFEGYHRDHDRPGLHEYSLGKNFPESAQQKAIEKIRENRTLNRKIR